MLLSWAMLAAGCVIGSETVTNDAHLWTDAEGRVIIHRGINLSNEAKRAEGYLHGRTATELQALVDHGFTAVRLLSFWEAIEPHEGAYDAEYIEALRAEIEDLEALGLDVILDLHQDVYGAGFDYAGFPEWTCDAQNYEGMEHSTISWFFDYFNQGVLDCFDAFWADADLQDAYAEMVAHLVSEVNDSPAVVGVDVINEPFWGTMSVELHETEVLPTFYGTIVDAVRAVDDDIRIWLAPSAGSNVTY